MYTQIIVSYDISNTKNRNIFFDELKNLGLISIQKSVFWGYVMSYEKRIIRELFKKYCNTKTDKAFISRVSLDEHLKNCFGYNAIDFKHPEGFEII